MKNVRGTVPTLTLLVTLVGFPQISESIFTPILPALQQTLHVSANRVQLTMSVYFISFALGVLIWGQLADRWGRRPALLAGIVIYLIGNVGLLLSQTLTGIIISRLVQAFGASTGSVVTQTIMRESFHGRAGAKIFAQTSAALALAPALGPLIGGAIQTWAGERNVFVALVILAILVFGYAVLALPETRPQSITAETDAQQDLLHRLWRDPVVWAYGILIGGINGMLFSYYAEAPFIFETHFHFRAVTYGALGLSLALASLLGSLLVNWLLTWWQPQQLIIGGLSLSCLASAGLWLAAINNQPGWLVIGFFLAFLGFNVTLPNALNRALVGYEAVMGRASGWFSLGYYCLVSALTYGMSVLHGHSIQTLPKYFLGTAIVMLTVFGLVDQRHRHKATS
ncbi:multidrug effflux MFS transporter [Furfurilactobacillus sp. WILCCON 0119]